MPEKIKLIGYGSLINRKSLMKTIKEHSGFHEVWVHGFKRVFDIKSVKHLYEPWDVDIAVLNVQKSKNSRFNAVVYEVSVKQFQNLLAREKTYELVKVKYSNYHTNKPEGEAFMFIGLEQHIHKHLNPRTHYFHVCRQGAYLIAQEYGENWDRTTYLANGKRVSEIRDLIKLDHYAKIERPYQDELEL